MDLVAWIVLGVLALTLGASVVWLAGYALGWLGALWSASGGVV